MAVLVDLAAHQVRDGQSQDAVEHVDPDFVVCPVEHGAEPDDVGVFELAEPRFDIILGSVSGDDVSDGPFVAVGHEQPFAEELIFQVVAGVGVDAPIQAKVGWFVAGQFRCQDPVDPAFAGDRVDVGLHRVAVAPGFAPGQCRGQLAELADRLVQGLIEAAGLGQDLVKVRWVVL